MIVEIDSVELAEYVRKANEYDRLQAQATDPVLDSLKAYRAAKRSGDRKAAVRALLTPVN